MTIATNTWTKSNEEQTFCFKLVFKDLLSSKRILKNEKNKVTNALLALLKFKLKTFLISSSEKDLGNYNKLHVLHPETHMGGSLF